MSAQTGRIAIVTGANNGIGFETTVGMAEAGFHVVMACRSQAKAEAAKTEVLARVPSASLDIILLDLSDLASVRAFAEAYRTRYTTLDVLINNAGILLYSARTNAQGVDLQFATNHLGHFLLTALLIDLIPDNPASRIVSLSSIAHKGASIHFDDLTCGQDPGLAYGQSKLACLLFGDELDRRLRASGKVLKSLTVHPGGSDSGLFQDLDDASREAMKAQVEQLLHSNEDAAKPSLFAALSEEVEGGDYYGPTGPEEMSGETGDAIRNPICDDHDVAKRLWLLSEEMTGQTFSV
ncbi:SDR family NAD(P)-dependent oxidoreductase [Ruegeria sp. R13_0]|uniref:oxidoreductase n=1 Tax=Ruegeria sp. R13_0 TaxID=2821099 RepID=UPI001ADB1483|nr:oxidoreductase [Ruegeria sp. R13_0]MBO9433749.1 SDR family NAD(P)-dependent oxidoreductase [Ruegeria sp. R13_0]